jgi:hypothetical protein
VEKGKIGWPFIREGGPCHQDHHQMNAHVLSDAQAIQRRNDQKAATQTCKRPKESEIESFF